MTERTNEAREGKRSVDTLEFRHRPSEDDDDCECGAIYCRPGDPLPEDRCEWCKETQ